MNDLLHIASLLRPDVELALSLLIAIAVTVHVLLTRREVAPSAGWIGLAWFAPFLGGFLYFVLGINRVQRRARRVRGGPAKPRRHGRARLVKPTDRHLSPLEKAIGLLTERPVEPGNTWRILQNGDEAYPAMLAAIAGAKASVALSSYIMRADSTGMRFVAALRAAQDRGVAVRVIVDGVGSGWLRSRAYSALLAAGLPAQRFMHTVLPWRMPFLNLRTHQKILVVDGRLAFTGGINIANQNELATNPAHPVQDTHFELHGPVVAQLVEAFARDWAFCTERGDDDGEALDGPAWFPNLTPKGHTPARVVTAGPDQDLEKIKFAVQQAIACAQTRITVMTPYFLPDQQLISALSLAAMRGVDVQITLPEHGDHRLMDWAWRANIGPLLQDGCRVFLSPPPFRHSKVMVVDGAWCLIGSSNWDMRSFRLNFELCVEITDPTLATTLEALVAGWHGRQIDEAEIRSRGIARRLRDSAARLLLPYL
jgi:cardiolipin synthase